MADGRIDELRRRLERDPGSRLFAQLAEELRKAGEFEEAIDVARAGLALHPMYPSARLTLGRALLDSGDPRAARVELEAAVKGAPDNILANRMLGEALESLGDLPSALAQYKATLSVAPEDRNVEAKVQAIEAGFKTGGGERGGRAGAASRAPGPEVKSPIAGLPPPLPPAARTKRAPDGVVGADEGARQKLPPPTIRIWARGEPPLPVGAAPRRGERGDRFEAGAGGSEAAQEGPPQGQRKADDGGAGGPPIVPSGDRRVADTEEALRPTLPPRWGDAGPGAVDEAASGRAEGSAHGEGGAAAGAPDAVLFRSEPWTSGGPAPEASAPEPVSPRPAPPEPGPVEAAPPAPVSPEAARAPRAAARSIREWPAPEEESHPAVAPAATRPKAPAAESPGSPLSSVTLAELYFQQGLLERAVEVYRRVLDEEPGNARARVRLDEVDALIAAGSAGLAVPAPSADERGEVRRRTLERSIERLGGLLAVVRRR